jgi:hypothetical protein
MRRSQDRDIAGKTGIPSEPEGAFSAIEAGGISAVLVETTRDIEIEISCVKASVNPESVGEDGLDICSFDTGGEKLESRIAGDRILNAYPSYLCSRLRIVLATSIRIARIH